VPACLHGRRLPACLHRGPDGRARKETATAFLQHALAWFAGNGVVVERVMTDNGNCYRGQMFRQACAGYGLRHLRTRPYTPRTNGKAERFIQTSLRECAYARPYLSYEQRSVALTTWLDQYNTARPHTALGGCSPAVRLRQYQLLGSTEGTVASSRPVFPTERTGGTEQGSPKATGDNRRAASLRRPAAASHSHQERPSPEFLNNLRSNDS
jgi:hypothetical protein